MGGHLAETDRSGLVAGYVGQTVERTAEAITEALDGVLLIGLDAPTDEQLVALAADDVRAAMADGNLGARGAQATE